LQRYLEVSPEQERNAIAGFGFEKLMDIVGKTCLNIQNFYSAELACGITVTQTAILQNSSTVSVSQQAPFKI
jgi:hypothetical protein